MVYLFLFLCFFEREREREREWMIEGEARVGKGEGESRNHQLVVRLIYAIHWLTLTYALAGDGSCGPWLLV